MSQPSWASTLGQPRTSRKNCRAATASSAWTSVCTPVIIASTLRRHPSTRRRFSGASEVFVERRHLLRVEEVLLVHDLAPRSTDDEHDPVLETTSPAASITRSMNNTEES